ncbi:N-acetyltransferase [Fictibacillus sp. B-59209]|uniref:GNAT family N-acetyltransferase n=1 Tax=Fictibacillus sp. B-59209 TaxID=3024873 RepID=UPI002E21ACBE|nr:N-acetyltransferase [Fictibacillus sp. B-59209]
MPIRIEKKEDFQTTEDVIKQAFKHAPYSDQKEHGLVKRLRSSKEFIPELSLVYEDGGKILGHILYTKVQLKNDTQSYEALALAPVSVLPSHQNLGIGKAFITAGLEKAKELNYKAVVVLGHPEYYPKFGFKKAALWGIKAPFEVPGELFMAMELQQDSLKGVQGIVEYSPAFFE